MTEQERTTPDQEDERGLSRKERVELTVAGTAVGAIMATTPEVTAPLLLTAVAGTIVALLLQKMGYCHEAHSRIAHLMMTSGISSVALKLALALL